MNKILQQAKDNGYFMDMYNYITDEYSDILEKVDGKWTYMRRDPSGRDFFSNIPIEYITDDERDSLLDYLIGDMMIEDYEWNDDLDDVTENLYEYLWDALYDELQKNV